MNLIEANFIFEDSSHFSLAEYDHIWLIQDFKKTNNSALADPRIQEILNRFMPKDFRLMRTALGRPFAHSEQGFCPSFSLTHTADIAVLALSLDSCLGVDAELISERPLRHKIAQRYFGQELELQDFYNAWTAREAFIKAIGGALFQDLAHIEHSGAQVGFAGSSFCHKIDQALIGTKFVYALCRSIDNKRSLRYFRAPR